MLKTRKTMVSWQVFPSLPPLAPKTPFPIPFKRLRRRLAFSFQAAYVQRASTTARMRALAIQMILRNVQRNLGEPCVLIAYPNSSNAHSRFPSLAPPYVHLAIQQILY